jgi:hypothetical protein
MMSVARGRLKGKAMSYSHTFTFRLSADERQLLAMLARHLYRTESDTIRWLLYEAARERGIVSQPAVADTEGNRDGPLKERLG